ncbi:MAG: hypothetical protein KGI54_13045 [Pseudomonadota bacterium]|nr:hypothetical protein [Pseudomonadota bacterium]
MADTLLVPSGNDGFHLFIILNDPISIDCYPGLSCILVCVCSIPGNGVFYDNTCTLEAGSHSFIKHRSYIAYRHTRIETDRALQARVADGVFKLRASCADPPFSEIKDGLNTTSHTKNAFKNLLI